MLRLILNLTGRVQGVSLRAAAKRTAEVLEVGGYAKNNADGSVTIEVEGEDEAVNEFIDWLKKYVSPLKIESLSVAKSELKNYESFEIRF